jgi:hypothetical protein
MLVNMRSAKQFKWYENETDFTANRVMLCVTLHVAAKSDCAFVGSKHTHQRTLLGIS